ncbi:MAG: Rpn family recombination-promoting nuclease/putative transposase [Gammaproteobacteria bacterium]
MCRINPKVDFAFKKLFGSEENKDLLLALINAVLNEEPHIAEIELKNPYNLADYRAGKLSILDIKARDGNGRRLNIEMQISEDLNFDKRAIYYWAKLVTDQLSEGMMFKELKKTISINIIDFNFVPGETFHNVYKIINTGTLRDDKLHDIFELHYLELRKFHTPFPQLATALDRWAAFLSRAHELDKNRLPETLQQDPAIRKAVEAVDRLFDEEERLIYEVRMQALAEVESKIVSAEEKGRREGKLEGLQKGIAKGKREAVLQLAISLLEVLDSETIAAKTGLSRAEIDALRQEKPEDSTAKNLPAKDLPGF